MVAALTFFYRAILGEWNLLDWLQKRKLNQRSNDLSSLRIAPQVTEDDIHGADPNDVDFREVEVKFSDTWDQFHAWLTENLPNAEFDSIHEDPNSESSFYCSGKPGELTWPVLVSGKKSGIPFTQRYDLVRDWLHPTAESLAPADAGIPWDTGLFPQRDKNDEEIFIAQQNAKLRDCRYWILFATLRRSILR